MRDAKTDGFPACPAPFNLADYVLSEGRKTPSKEALVILAKGHSERWSYARLERAVKRVAGAFTECGLTPGARILLRMGNQVAFPVAYLGAIYAGYVPAPTSAQLTTREITKLSAIISPELIATAGDAVAMPEGEIASLDIAAILESAGPSLDAPVMAQPDDLAYIIFTSGTSGSPRAVAHAHRAMWARRSMWEGWYGLTSDDQVLHAGAFNWTFTLGTGLLDPWSRGATALILKDSVNTTDLISLLREHDATIFAAAPGIYRRILKQTEELRFPALRRALSAGEKLAEPLRQEWQTRTGVALCEAYGMTECSTFISARPNAPGILKVQDERLVTLLGKNDAGLGQIAVSQGDPGVMLGYWKDGRIDTSCFQDGWFPTGDMAVVSDGERLDLQGRSDDMINAGGIRVSPLEIEAAFAEMPELAEVAAFEVKVATHTTVIAVFYVCSGFMEDDALRSHAQSHLAHYKQPRLYIPVKSLPKGANNKLLRKQLRADFEAENGYS